MKHSESKKKRESKGEKPEYVVKVHYGTEKLQACIQNLMTSMSRKGEAHAEDI